MGKFVKGFQFRCYQGSRGLRGKRSVSGKRKKGSKWGISRKIGRLTVEAYSRGIGKDGGPREETLYDKRSD